MRHASLLFDLQVDPHIGHLHNLEDVGQTYKVLIEGNSKKSDQEFKGRNSQNKMINFPKKSGYAPGDYVMVHVTSTTTGTLRGEIID